MQRAASFLLLALGTLMIIHVIQDAEGAKRYAKFLLTGKGPNGGIGETASGAKPGSGKPSSGNALGDAIDGLRDTLPKLVPPPVAPRTKPKSSPTV